MTAHPKKPCHDCPFRRDIKPDTLGGSHPLTYVGQSIGPFFLPCHTVPGYQGNASSFDRPQCAGAAIFRANIGVAELMPSGIHQLSADRETVFASHAEFLAHHRGMTVEEAAFQLERRITPVECLMIELGRPGVRTE